jgi:long-chain acyl-CoA synthetase
VSRTDRPLATLAELVRRLAGENRRDDLLRFHRSGRWRTLSSGEVCERIRRIAAGLAEVGIGPGDRVGLLSWNRPEWTLVDLAVVSTGAVCVPIYPNLPYQEVTEVLRRSGARAVFVSHADQYAKVERGRDHLPYLGTTVVFDPWGLPGEAEVLEQFEARGERRLRREPDFWEKRAGEVRPEQLATVIFTSGTTGEPKGVLLTHDNLCSNVEAVLQVLEIRPEDNAYSYLPLAHILERLVELVYLACGAQIAYARSLERLGDDLLELRPTVMTVVPRVLEKIRDRALTGMERLPGPLRRTSRWAVAVGQQRGDRRREGRAPGPWLSFRAALADALLLRRLREHLGGRMRLILCGGAPLPPRVCRFFWGASVPVVEGYGLTETSPVVALNPTDRPRLGTVGPPLPGVEVRLADDGEILVRGPSVTQGYWEAPEASAEALAGGWFHTGDLGRFDEKGYLEITGRKKEILVTSGGKNVSPVKVESLLLRSAGIEQAMVVGDGRSHLGALLVPAMEIVSAWAAEEGLGGLDRSDLLRHPRIQQRFQRELERLQSGLASFETVKCFHLLDRGLTIEQGLLTPSLKIRRRKVAEVFAREIDSLYR